MLQVQVFPLDKCLDAFQQTIDNHMVSKKGKSPGQTVVTEWRHQVNDVITEVKLWHHTAKEAQTFYLDVSWSIFSD